MRLSFFGLQAVALGVFSLAVAASAQAQTLTLNSGDSATVTSAGTVGVIGGMPVNNNVSLYDSFGTDVQTSGTAAFTLAGGTLIAPDASTGIYAQGSGPVTISGGSIGASHGSTGLDDEGTGRVVISGGTFRADSSPTFISSVGIAVGSGAAVQVTGGSFSGAPFSVGTGGTLYLFSRNDTPFTVSGIPGTSFTQSFNNTSLNLSSIPGNNFSTYGITGTLADGESLSSFLIGRGTVDFNLPVPAAVPEASTTVSLGLLLMLGLGGLMRAKCRAKTAAAFAA